MFSFPQFMENALFQELIIGIATNVLKFFLRLSFVLAVWLLIIPFMAVFEPFIQDVHSYGLSARVSSLCQHFVHISWGIRDYFRHLREIGGHDADREDEGDRNGARAARRIGAQVNRNIAAVDVNGEDVVNGAQRIGGAGQLS